MRAAARYIRAPLFVAALVIGAGATAALAQELQLDPKALGASVAPAGPTVKGKKAKGQAGGATAGKPAANGPNRQFGELEGWSPGKAPPPKPGETPVKTQSNEKAEDAKAPPIGMSPSGNMAIGLPF